MWLIGILIILIRGNVANQVRVEWLDVDFVTILTAYIMIAIGQAASGVFAFGMGLLIDCYSAGLLGLFTTIQMVALLSMYLGSRFLDIQSPRSVFFLVTLGAWAKGMLFIGLLNALSLETGFSLETFTAITLSALLSGLIAPFIFYVMNKIRRLSKEQKNQAKV